MTNEANLTTSNGSNASCRVRKRIGIGRNANFGIRLNRPGFAGGSNS